MKKVFAVVLIVAMMATMFAGCGAKETSDALKIGSIGPLTGGAAVYGQAVKAGMEIAVEEINAMDGLKVELNFLDDEHDPEKSVNQYNKLKDWGMQILGGTVTTDPCKAVAAECVADRIFLLTPSASDPSIPTLGDNIFQICFTDTNQGTASAKLIIEKNLGTKIGVIYDTSSAYSAGIYETFKAVAEEENMNVVCVETFTDANKSDLTTQVTKCQEAGADLVFLPFYATEAAQVLTYANKIGYAPIFFGCDGMDGILEVENFDASLAEGLIMLTPFAADAEDEATKSFVAKYQEKTGVVPNQFAADGYDVVYAIYYAAQAAGIDGNTSPETACAELMAQFTNMTFDGLTGKGIEFAADGTVAKDPTAVVVKDGAYVGIG